MKRHTKSNWITVLFGTAFTWICCLLLDQSSVPVQAVPKDGILLPVIAYHQVLPDGKGTFDDRTISLSELESDLSYLQEQGYQAIVGQDLIDHVIGLRDLPEKPIFLTFDDGYQSFIQLVYPLLQKYEMKATVSIIGSETDTYSQNVPKERADAHLSWAEVKELDQSGIVEIGNHSYDFHEVGSEAERQGVHPLANEALADYRKAFSDDVLTLQTRMNEKLYHDARLFAYPYGFHTEESEQVLKELGFFITLTNQAKQNIICDKDSLFSLGRYGRPHGITSAEFFEQVLAD